MAYYFHNKELQEDCDWLTDYAFIPYEEYDSERTRLIRTKNRNISGVSDINIYALYNMTFYPIETIIERNLNNEKIYKEKRQKLELMKDIIKSFI